MSILPQTNEIQTLLGSAREILILTHQEPNQDSLGAALALFLAFSASGKRTTVACPAQVTVEFGNLIGIDKVSQTLGGQNFVISLDYIEGAIEKVSYNISGGKFNLVIEPRAGAPAFSPEKVNFSSGAINPDLIFLLDSANLEQLGKFYQDEKDLYSKVAVVNIDHHPNNSLFAKINLVDSSASSTSEIVTLFLQNLGFPLTGDIASNLLAGIAFATNNFTAEETSPGAFEAAAICLRAGGKRGAKSTTKPLKEERKEEAPAEWLQPKIFKSSSSLKSPKDDSTLL